jgi:hypothetical protein
MKSNSNQFKCYSVNLRDFLEYNKFEAWDRARDWNTGKPFWYFQFDDEGRLSKYLTMWSETKDNEYYINLHKDKNK